MVMFYGGKGFHACDKLGDSVRVYYLNRIMSIQGYN